MVWWKRSDGDLVRDVPDLRRIMPYVMRTRNESTVNFEQRLDVGKAQQFVRAFNEAHPETRTSLFHVLMWASRQGLVEFPNLNRFVSGGRLYQRKGVGVANGPALAWSMWPGSGTASNEGRYTAMASALYAGTDMATGRAMLVLAGAGEGLVLGLAQGVVLHRFLPHLAQRDWAVATAAAAALAWSIGQAPSTMSGLTTYHPALLVVGGVLLGSIFLFSIGGAQWLVLRHFVPHAGWWIGGNAVAWLLGVLVSVVGISMIPAGASFPLMILIGILSGVLMGLVVGGPGDVDIAREMIALGIRLAESVGVGIVGQVVVDGQHRRQRHVLGRLINHLIEELIGTVRRKVNTGEHQRIGAVRASRSQVLRG